MNKFKLVVCDMDGSFLDRYGRVLDVNFKALELLKSRGFKIAMATGRNIELIRPYIRDYCDFLVTNNGAIVYEKVENNWKTIFRKDLNHSMVFDYLKEVIPYCFGVQILYDDSIYSTKDKSTIEFISRTDELVKNGEDSEKSNALFRRVMRLIDDPLSVIKSRDDNVTKLDMFFDIKNTEKFDEITSKYKELNPILCFPGDVEVVPNDIDKGTGILEICNRLKIKTSEVLSFGDSGNDLKMKEVGSRFVAVSNSPEFVKIAADEICGNHNDGGIGKYIIEKIESL